MEKNTVAEKSKRIKIRIPAAFNAKWEELDKPTQTKNVYEWGFTRAANNSNVFLGKRFHKIKQFCLCFWGQDVYLKKLLQCIGTGEQEYTGRGFDLQLENRKSMFVQDMLGCYNANFKETKIAVTKSMNAEKQTFR